jgi:hypothetical protein
VIDKEAGGAGTDADADAGAAGNWERGEVQDGGCRDVIFGVLFYAMVIVIGIVAGTRGFPALKASKDTDNEPPHHYEGVLYYLSSTCAVAVGVAGLALLALAHCTANIITASIIFGIVVSLALAINCIFLGNILGVIIGFLGFLLGLCYFCLVQSRIPFATANLQTGVAATKANAGVFLAAYFFVALNIAWIFLWTVAFFGIMEGDKHCQDGKCHIQINGFVIFLFILSIFWVEAVFTNCVHVTVAGVVGTWWFAPDDAKTCCSPAVRGSLVRTLTTSFGSVCFGSLLIALIQALKALVEQLRRESDNGAEDCCLCLLECCLSCVENIAEYFNKYAFVYVGLYGYSYLEAGKKVMTLFDLRGFTLIINDNLVTNALNFMTFSVSMITAGIGLLIYRANPDWLVEFTGKHDTGSNLNGKNTEMTLPAFGLALLAGLLITHPLMAVLESAVNTVIVCFAEAPAEFEQNHPEHSAKMREAWRQVYDFEP